MRTTLAAVVTALLAGATPVIPSARATRVTLPDAVIVGRITDAESGSPLAGASILIDRTRIATRAGADGAYRLTIPADSADGRRMRLRVLLIGFAPVNRDITPKAGRVDTVNVALAPNNTRLEEVVVAPSPRDAPRLSPKEMRGYGNAAGGTVPLAAAPPTVGINELKSADQVLVMVRPEANAGRRIMGQSVMPPVSSAMSPDAPATQGTLRARDPDGKVVGEFPLRHTDVSAEISGYLARTVVSQRYTNPFERAIEAVYVFPLPSLAAVNDFVMQVGDRKIVGVVRPRAEAERIYREAMARGQTASLLTQERPNIFTQSVANIAPGGEVDIRITYVERLSYEHGEYEWVFPMVVGPRYIPGGARPPADLASLGGGQGRRQGDGGGWSPNTDVVPDASHITPPVLRPGERSGHDISLAVTLDAGLPITRLESVAHEVHVESPSRSRRIVRLASSDSIPNRDFVLRWSVAGAETQFGVLAHRDTSGGFLSLAMQPPRAPGDDQVMPREITFIMDVSGSMMGVPIAISKDLVFHTLDKLRPDDRFNVVYFSGTNAQLWERARRGTPGNIADAKRFLGNLSAGGGTEMLAGLSRALHAAHDPRMLQMYVFLTDGYVGDEERILHTIATERGDARFFGFGIGSSVNRYLIDGIGEQGGGESVVVIPRDTLGIDRAVSRLFDVIDSPVLVDVGIDWNGLPVEDAYPRRVPDLFAGQTIGVLARYTHAAHGTIYVTGRIGDRHVRYPVRVDLPERETDHASLAPAWARARIADLSSEMLTADADRRPSLEREITDLAVAHHLVSQFTAFVAVDESRIVGDGHPLRILQPVELPEGVSYKGVFGEAPVGLPMRIGAWGADVQGTARGDVRVGRVEPDGAAARAGIRAGAILRRVNGAAVPDVDALERILLQAGGSSVSVQTDAGGTATLPTP